MGAAYRDGPPSAPDPGYGSVTMRLAHITDLHVERPARAAELLNKRLLGEVNLHLFGRSAHFSKVA